MLECNVNYSIYPIADRRMVLQNTYNPNAKETEGEH